MDKPELAEARTVPPKQPWAIIRVTNVVTMVWLPGVVAVACLIVGIAELEASWFALAVVGGVFTFLGWRFLQGMEEPKPWK